MDIKQQLLPVDPVRQLSLLCAKEIYVASHIINVKEADGHIIRIAETFEKFLLKNETSNKENTNPNYSSDKPVPLSKLKPTTMGMLTN